MAIKTVRISDMSGAEIPAGTGARIRIMWDDKTRVDMRADVTEEEALKIARQCKAKDVETRPERRGERRVRI